MLKTNKVLGGILLVAGTSIGAGMLVLPVISAPSGFYYSSLLLILCWVFMYLTGLLVLEVNLSLDNEPSYISMAQATLGRVGGFFSWIFFLLLLYSLLAAYVSSGGDILVDFLKVSLNFNLSAKFGPVLWIALFASVIYFGVSFTDHINRLFMLGLMIAYASLMTFASPHVHVNLLNHGQPQYLLAALPVLFATLAFHIIVPSLRGYLDGDLVKLKKIIFYGSLLPLLVYIAWEFIVFGLIPKQGEHGLIAVLQSGHAATQITHSLQSIIKNAWVSAIAHFFIFFAIASSFLGVSYGLFDLIGDGLHIEKTHKGRFLTLFLTFLPPLIFAEAYPEGFIYALKYAGVFVAIIHGLFPVFMAVSGRYFVKSTTGYRVAGGLPILIIVAAFFLFVIFCDIAADQHWIPSML